MTDEPGGGDSGSHHSAEAVTEIPAECTGQRLPGRIGHFHIKDVLASGGMGVVYRAVQEHPRRTVAVKVMKHGIASRSAMRRFEYESQVLARLRHPGIAQVFEAGTHDDGGGAVPFFAMEYIPNAKPITRFAQERSLGTRERLTLFASVCDAVHHGHQKGIIHRDLKPDNILVDRHGHVKIIDFGVARGTDSDLAVTTLQTDVGQLIGTLQYMSPEQCEADPDAIDARSDVYALGVVLYELLAGQLPYAVSGKRLIHSTEVIREQAPTRPSTIDRTLRGDVETIVLKALEKDPDRRYAAAADFGKDIQAYLNRKAISARPPSTAYRARLFALRHRGKVWAGATLALIAAVATVMVARSHSRTRQAEEAMAAALKRASQAEMEAAASMKVGARAGQQGTDMIGQVPPEFSITTMDGRTLGTDDFGSYKATVLNFIAADCPFCFKQVPVLEEIRDSYEPKGVRFVNISLTYMKEFTAREASNIFARFGSRAEFARDEAERTGNLFKISAYPTVSVLDGSGTVRYVTIGFKSDFKARLSRQLDALILGIQAPEEALAEKEKLQRQTLEELRRTLGVSHGDTLQSMERLAATLTERDKYDEAEELYREIWEVRRRSLGERDPQTLESMHELGVVLQEHGKLAEAEALHRQVLEVRQSVLGASHPATRLSMAHVGMALHAQGKSDGAGPYIAELIDLRRRAAEAPDADARTLNEYASLLLTCEPAELRDVVTALGVAEAAVKASTRQDWRLLDTLALAQKMNGDLAGAIETQKEAIARQMPGDFLRKMSLEQKLAAYYKEAGDLDAMEEWCRDNLARTRASMPAGSVAVGISLSTLGRFLLEQERYVEAEPVLREILDIVLVGLPEYSWHTLEVESALGQSLIGQGRFEEAERLVVDAYLRMKDDQRVPTGKVREAFQRVMWLYTAWRKPDEAARFRATMQLDSAVAEAGP